MSDAQVARDLQPYDVESHTLETTSDRQRRAAVLEAEADTDRTYLDETQFPMRPPDEVDLDESRGFVFDHYAPGASTLGEVGIELVGQAAPPNPFGVPTSRATAEPRPPQPPLPKQ